MSAVISNKTLFNVNAYYTPIQYNFAQDLADWTTLSTLTSLPANVSVTAANTGMIIDSTGKLTWAPNNKLQYTNDLSTAYWLTFGTTKATAQTDPFGGTSAIKLVEDSVNSLHYVGQSGGAASVNPNNFGYDLFSLYAKAAEHTKVFLYFYYGINDTNRSATFNLTGGGSTGSVDPTVTAGIQSVGNGWYRCWILKDCSGRANNTGCVGFGLTNTDVSITSTGYQGNGVNGAYFYGAQLENVTYQNTPAPYMAAASSTPYVGSRFEYNPNTLTARGLLLEPQRTNLLTYSQDLSTNWSAYLSTIRSAGSGTNPAGVSGKHASLYFPAYSAQWFQTYNVTNGVSYTFSVWARTTSGTAPFYLNWYGSGGSGDYDANTPTHVATTTWQRFSYTYTSTHTETTNFIIGNLGAAGATIEFYGAQLEVGLYPTSYIPTLATAVTRTGEVCTLSGYANRAVDAFYSDESLCSNGNTTLIIANSRAFTANAPSPVTINANGWITSVRTYTGNTAGSISLPSWITFTRSSSATMFDSTGTLVTVANNIPRFDYDPSTNPPTPKGLLIEEGRTNYWYPSEQLAAPLLFDNVSFSAANTLAPNGTLTAGKLIEDNTNNAHAVYYIWAGGGALTATLSAYLKADTRIWGMLRFYDNGAGTGYNAWFNLANGAIGTVNAGLTAGMNYVGNGWYRCWITRNMVGAFAPVVSPASSDGLSVYTGASQGIYVWGVQNEYGSFPTSYIPTTSGAAARAAESPTLNGIALSLAGASTGSIIGQVTQSLYNTYPMIVGGASDDFRDRWFMYGGGPTAVSSYDNIYGNSITIGNSGTWNGPVRAAIGWSSPGATLVANGGTPSNNPSQNFSTGSTVYVGSAGGLFWLNGWLASLSFYNRRLPDAVLQGKSIVGSPL